MNDITKNYSVFIHRKDVDRFYTIVSNFDHNSGLMETLFNKLHAGYRLKMHDHETIILRLSIEDISITESH